MPPLSQVVAVALGAVLGAWLRWGLSSGLNPMLWGGPSPLGTLLANWLGALLMGVALGVLSGLPGLRPEWRLLFCTGFLGALTTFSTWSAESVVFVQEGDWQGLALHILVHTLGSVGLTLLGLRCTLLLLERASP